MSIDSKLQVLRTILRRNSKIIITHLLENFIYRNKKATSSLKVCSFCGSTNKITKEHVIPRWIFEKSTSAFFTTDINGLDQTYNKTTVTACHICNTDRLNALEKYIGSLFNSIDLKKRVFTNEEKENIIRWLEIIDYKFQVLNVTRKFKASKQVGYIPYLADFPLAVLRSENDYSPIKATTEIRRSQKRITVKNKINNINSLVTFKSNNLSFHFFHKMDDFIFIELPKQQIALFYFYNNQFKNEVEGFKEAMKIIKKVY